MTGSEPTFDGQPMQAGWHFRWSFVPELGFPPGGFWLCRRPSRMREDCIELPEALLWDREVDPCIPPGAPTATWGEPDWEGWQVFGEPFMLPITTANWPARYEGAPNPGDADVVARDIAEAQRRLGTLQLEPGVENTQHLLDLRNTLARLVSGFPSTLLFNQLLAPSSDPSAPQFKVTLIEQLLMLAANPHLARVLGLYTVLPVNPGEESFDYCLVGRWGNTFSPILFRDRPIGTLYAVFPAPRSLPPLLAPATPPILTSRQRRAEIVEAPAPPKLVPFSIIEVMWDAPDRDDSKDPLRQVITAAPPNEAIGFVAERLLDNRVERLLQIIPPIRQAKSKDDLSRVYRLFDRQPDPVALLRYQVAGFNAFGMLGAWSPESNPLVITPLFTSPQVKLISFDNSSANGGSVSPEPNPGWQGGTLHMTVSVSGAELYHHPDTRSLNLIVEQLQPTRQPLLSQTLTLPTPVVLRARVTQIQLPQLDPRTHQPFTQLDPDTGKPFTLITLDAAFVGVPLGVNAFLVLVGNTNDLPIVDRYSIQPTSTNLASFSVPYIENSPLAKNQTAFINQTAYLIQGYFQDVTLALPSLFIPANLPSVQGRVAAYAIEDPVIDPDHPKFPSTAKASFTAPQRWIPPTPPQPTLPLPTHIVHHEYFDPPDFYGQARITKLPFITPALADTPMAAQPLTARERQEQRGGYLLLRAPAANLFLTDVKRRQNLLDASPVLTEADGAPRNDLVAWIQLLPEWLAAYNDRRHHDNPLSADRVLMESDGQRSFVEHFYGGLLDDELRSLANLPENLSAFRRTTADPFPPQGDVSLTDSIEGQGFRRVLYKVQAVSKAVNSSEVTLAAGPYYTRITAPPPAPTIIKVTAQAASLIVVWTLSEDPEIAGYVMYRAGSEAALADLRFFGNETELIDLSKLAGLHYQPRQSPALTFGAGETDPRIIALVPDPRLFARDYDGSNMAEVVFPAVIVPSEILGVYRASEFSGNSAPAHQPQAFNYFRPAGQGGISQLIVEGTQASITGLRVGLGRPVEVVVVAKIAGETRVLGALSVRRATFFDGGTAGHPVELSALPRWIPPDRTTQTVYAIVAVDRFGNRSQSSKPFIVQPF
jgi:hypothetical protein